MKVLVTGGNGFIGQHLVPELRALGFEVHAVDREDADITQPDEQRKLLERIRPTHLLHLAWYTAHGKFWTATENMKWVSASLNLLENFAQVGGRRAVFAGTCAEYDWGYTPPSAKFSETAPLNPSTLYGVCKNSLQQIFSKISPQLGISSAWGRIFMLYGPFESETRLIPTAIRALLLGQEAKFTHGRQIRDFMHVEDVARGFAQLLKSDLEGPINIASGEPIAIHAVLDRIGKLIGRPELLRLGALPEPRPGNRDEPANLVADTARLKEELRFSPRYSLDSGLRMTVKWWEERMQGQ